LKVFPPKLRKLSETFSDESFPHSTRKFDVAAPFKVKAGSEKYVFYDRGLPSYCFSFSNV